MLLKSSHASQIVMAVIALAAGAAVHAKGATPASPWLHRAYETADGLPDMSTTGVAQTSDGYLWVATKGGLLRFNGEEFATMPRTNFPVMPSRAVRAMFRDHRDHIWLGMERGPLLCLKPNGLQTFTARDGLPGGRVLVITEDREHSLWVVYPNHLRRIVNGEVKSIALPPNSQEPVNLVVGTDRQGNIWCAKGTDLGIWREGKWEFSMRLESPVTALGAAGTSNVWVAAGGWVSLASQGSTPLQAVPLPPKATAQVLFEDHAGALWVGTSADGLFRWNGERLERIPTSHREITCLSEDREDNIWAGTAGGGLNLIRRRVAALIGRDAGLPFESVLSVTQDTAGRLWAAAQDGQLAREGTGGWELLTSTTNWPGGRSTCVCADRQGGVWVGTSDRGLRYSRDGAWREWSRRTGLASDSVRSLLVASNGDVWVATDSPGRLHRMREGQVVGITKITSRGAIRALAESADGTIWMGTSVGELERVRGTALVPEPANADSERPSVRCLLATTDGSLWIGYAGEGLGHLKDGAYQRLTSAAGLADDFISQLLPDASGNLWICGNRGLSRVSLAELNSVLAGQLQRINARTYRSADGLPGVQPNRDYSPSAWRGNDGRLWFSMRNGLLVVEPEKIGANPHPPPVQVESVTVDDQLVALYNAGSPLQTQPARGLLNLRSLTAPLPVGPGHRKLEIEFAASSFTSPGNVQFRYRLSGFDPDWVEAGGRRRATYPRLPAGDYEFRVLACNNAGVWNDTGAAFALVVSPFFWETWWFRISAGLATVLAAGGSAFLISRRRYRQKLLQLEARRALEQERARIARDIHDDLGASLTRITLLSRPARAPGEHPQHTTASLAQIHQTARDLTHAMGQVVWAVNPEHDTFDSLASYLSHHAQNTLGMAGIRCRIEMPMQLPKQPLSSEIRHNLFLAFKEALNNVLKHAKASEVRISLTLMNSGFALSVADNGRGFSTGMNAMSAPGQGAFRQAAGNGLANMRARLREIGGDCDLQSEPGAGTCVTFRLKFKIDYGQQ